MHHSIQLIRSIGLKGYIIRWTAYSEHGFKEGLSLTMDDELGHLSPPSPQLFRCYLHRCPKWSILHRPLLFLLTTSETTKIHVSRPSSGPRTHFSDALWSATQGWASNFELVHPVCTLKPTPPLKSGNERLFLIRKSSAKDAYTNTDLQF